MGEPSTVGPVRRLAAWNIRQGGGSGNRRDRILAALLGFDADLLVVSEFRIGKAGEAIRAALSTAGYHLSHPPADAGRNTVLLASRRPIEAAGALDPALADVRHLWRVATGGLCVVGVYMPVGAPKLPYWAAVVRAASAASPPDLFVGDFNTGRDDLDKEPRGAAYVGAASMTKIDAAGHIDLWRSRHPSAREYTWVSPQGRNGFRLDHAFGSARFAATVRDCRYDHAVRLDAVSDHSALIVEHQAVCPDVPAPGGPLPNVVTVP